eukprot:6173582-Pleurochrysis_carterae.AAC.1
MAGVAMVESYQEAGARARRFFHQCDAVVRRSMGNSLHGKVALVPLEASQTCALRVTIEVPPFGWIV